MAEDRRIPIQVVSLPVVTGPLTYFGTPGLVIQDVTASFNQTVLNNNFADVGGKINELITLTSALLEKQNEILNSFKVGGGPK